MLYREIIAVCSEIHTKHIIQLCGKNVELWNVKLGGTYSNHQAWKGSNALLKEDMDKFYPLQPSNRRTVRNTSIAINAYTRISRTAFSILDLCVSFLSFYCPFPLVLAIAVTKPVGMSRHDYSDSHTRSDDISYFMLFHCLPLIVHCLLLLLTS
jgi:hypothetical protein